MILQALHEYYQRKMSDPDPAHRLPALGFEDKEIPFIIELAVDGSLINIKDTRSGDGKKRSGALYLVPKGAKKASGVLANCLWDTPESLTPVARLARGGRGLKQANRIASADVRASLASQGAGVD